MPSKKALAVILAIVIVVLSIVDYHQYHLDRLSPGGKFDFQFMRSFEPQLQLNPTSGIELISTPSNNSQPVAVPELGVYDGDPSSNTPKPLTAIDWSANGPIALGQIVNSTRLYLRNEGTMPITLFFSTLDWSFKDADGKPLLADYSEYFALTWDYDNSSIAVNEIRPVTFSLTVSPGITDVSRFFFNLVIISIY